MNIPDLITPDTRLDDASVAPSLGKGRVKKTVTFATTVPGATTLFTVTGDVVVRVAAICKTTLTIQAGATLEVGISGATAAIIAQTAGDAIDVNEIWHDASPDALIEAVSVLKEFIISNGSDIIATIGTDDIDTGEIDFYCFWEALSEGATVVAA